LRWILPAGLRGSSSTNSIERGDLEAGQVLAGEGEDVARQRRSPT
jgi:hypothetical protein